MQACSAQFQRVVAKDPSMAVSQVTWSPDGYMIGVAFTKHLIHLYVYEHRNKTREVVEIEAHSGEVNDIAFSQPNKQLCVVTCGDDKLIRVWDMHGQKIYSFEGHEAPVYSICPHHIDDIQFIFSFSLDGKMKAWFYDNVGSRVDFDVPGKWCTTMLYSADGTRLFSCGTSKQGDSHLVEWNQSEGSVKRSYSGFRKKTSGVVQGVVQFDIARNHILAAGEDNQIKFWDVDNTNMLACIEAGGALPSFPRLRFNKEGNLLAVTTVDSGFKIIANNDGLKSLLSFGNLPSEVFRSPYEASTVKVSGAPVVSGISPNIGRTDHLDRNYRAKPSPVLNGGDPASGSIDKKRRISEEKSDKGKPWDLKEVLNPQKFRLDTMLETDQASKVSKVLDDDDLLREIIIRVGFPTTLVRAALVCKRCLLNKPQELAAVVRSLLGYSWDAYRGAPANFLCSRNGRVFISLYDQDGYSGTMNDLFSVEEVNDLSLLHVSVVSNMQRTKSTVHVHMWRHGDGVWRTYLTLDTDQLLDPRREPKAVLANNKIYIASAQSDIVVFDLTASSISMFQLPQGVEYGDRDTMLARAQDASGYRVEDESYAPLRIKHVGDYAEFMFLEMGRCALQLDVKCMQLRKVYIMAEEEVQLGDIHPLKMIWPPMFPALKDNPASSK
uniref:F-box protein AT5G49610-like beta-propeller domain-containing protein n=1 Tax=Triticum urartu TaxID=4572 RepID=A0A8R7UQB9_TRIUA